MRYIALFFAVCYITAGGRPFSDVHLMLAISFLFVAIGWVAKTLSLRFKDGDAPDTAESDNSSRPAGNEECEPQSIGVVDIRSIRKTFHKNKAYFNVWIVVTSESTGGLECFLNGQFENRSEARRRIKELVSGGGFRSPQTKFVIEFSLTERIYECQ